MLHSIFYLLNRSDHLWEYFSSPWIEKRTSYVIFPFQNGLPGCWISFNNIKSTSYVAYPNHPWGLYCWYDTISSNASKRSSITEMKAEPLCVLLYMNLYFPRTNSQKILFAVNSRITWFIQAYKEIHLLGKNPMWSVSLLNKWNGH